MNIVHTLTSPRHQKTTLVVGSLISIFGVLLAVIDKNPHFYTPFSLGLAMVFLVVHKRMGHRDIFEGWNGNAFAVFFSVLTLVCIIIDVIGLKAGYWNYPNYTTLFDDILKYAFEWVIALFYFFMAFVGGADLFEKNGVHKVAAHILSLLVVVIPLGFVTEYLNLYMYSWNILSMPISNYSFGGFFLIFQTLGYMLMPLVTFVLYILVHQHYVRRIKADI